MCDVTSVKSKPNHKSISMNGQHEEAMQYLCLHNQPQTTHQPSKAFTFFSGYILIDFTLILEKRIKWILCRVHSVLHHLFSFLPTCHVGSPCPPKLTLGLSIFLLFFVALSSKRQRHHTHGKKIQTLDNAFDEQVTPPPAQFNLFNRKSTPRTTIQEAPLLNHYLILAVAAAAANNNNNSTGGEGIEKGQFPGICTSAVSSWWCCAVLPGQIGATIFFFFFFFSSSFQ